MAHGYQPAHRHHGGRHVTRRQVLAGLLGAAAAAAAAVVRVTTEGHPSHPAAVSPPPTTPPATDPVPSSPPPSAIAGPVQSKLDAVRPGAPEVIFGGDPALANFALTFDDGTCPGCAAAIVTAVQQTGFHATFSPNGTMGPTVWDSHAEAIAALAATGQVSLCNHTWDHKDMTKLSAAQIKDELLRNEDWIQQRFGVTSRPFYRPPYGAHDAKSDDIAGSIGFTKVVMWNGTFGDSIVHPPEFILHQLQQYLTAGTIMLGHANHPATASVIDQIIDQIQRSGFRPVTLLELLAPSPTPTWPNPTDPTSSHPTAHQKSPHQATLTVPSRPTKTGPVRSMTDGRSTTSHRWSQQRDQAVRQLASPLVRCPIRLRYSQRTAGRDTG